MGSCPLTQRELIEEYFIEHRTRVLDLAAFLDRFDRAAVRDAGDDFRIQSLRAALRALLDDTNAAGDTPRGGGRMLAVQMLLSDPRSDVLPELDRKSAFGAYGGR